MRTRDDLHQSMRARQYGCFVSDVWLWNPVGIKGRSSRDYHQIQLCVIRYQWCDLQTTERVREKNTVLSLFTHPHVFLNPFDFLP